MTNRFIYPGSFCPPTFGHFRLAERCAQIFPELIVVCSSNPDKSKVWFDEKECKEMWSAYRLPANVKVMTFSEFIKILNKEDKVIMVRGLRDKADFQTEKEVMFLNKDKYGIMEFFYMFSECYYQKFSSSKARKAAEELDFETLGKIVTAKVVTKMLEKVLGFKNLFLVVGPTGCGKSTFLNFLKDQRDDIVTFDTDLLNKELRPLLIENFGNELIKVLLEAEEKVTAVIKDPWFKLLSEKLRSFPKDKHVFLEVPYALRDNKKIYRFLGGKIIYIGCKDDQVARKRIIDRGTPELLFFFDLIPKFKESKEIIEREKLDLVLAVDTNRLLTETQVLSETFARRLI